MRLGACTRLIVISDPDIDPVSVLVVDDDATSRLGLLRALREIGFRCETAPDGEAAWELLQKERFDIVLSDLRMPRVDGIELCRRVRARHGREQQSRGYVAFIIMSGISDREHVHAALGAGADEYLVKPIDMEELELRLANAERVARTQKRLRRDSEGAFLLARIDPLTGVSNRLRMEEDLRTLVAESTRYGGRSVALAMCDVDYFKRFNDSHGHVAGDEKLREVAQTLRDTLREADRVYRYGGEEFVVLLPEQCGADAVLAMDRVRAAVERRCGITLSAGIAELTPETRDVASWLRAADAALYRAKDAGRNRVVAA